MAVYQRDISEKHINYYVEKMLHVGWNLVSSEKALVNMKNRRGDTLLLYVYDPRMIPSNVCELIDVEEEDL